MKYFLLIFINLFVFKSYGQEFTSSRADSLRNIGNSYYDSNPRKCITYLDSAALLYDKLDKKKQRAYCIQNIAFVFHEKLNNIDSSIIYIEKAIAIWKELKEPLNQANLFKYYGMLLSKQGEYLEGIEAIRKAIDLFEKNSFTPGKAVSYFDLALLYENASQIDSSIYYFKKNKAYFEAKQDTFRIFLVNNKLFENHMKKEKYNSASEIYENNLKLEKSSRVHWQHLIDYYKISMLFFQNTDNSELYDLNQEKYKQLSEKLTEQGIVIM